MAVIKMCQLSDIISLSDSKDSGVSSIRTGKSPVVWFSASVDGELVGCGGLRLSGKKSAVLQSLYVKSEYRGMGIGRDLITSRLMYGASKGITRYETNTPKVKLFESLGFTKATEKPYKFGGYKMVLTLHKDQK